MKLPSLVAIGLLSLAGFARAQGTEPSAPTCAVARDPQWISPAGVLHVLDGAGSAIPRWSLSTGAAIAPLAIGRGALAFAYFPARDALVIEHSDPPRLSLRPLSPRAPEQPFAALEGAPCGLAATNEHVIACVDHNHYVVFNSTGSLVREADVGGVSATTHSWDGMAWDGETRTLYATRTQGTFLGAIALPVTSDGTLHVEEATFVEPNDPNVPRGDEPLSLLPDGMRLVAPDGLILTTALFEIDVPPEDAPGDAFAIGDDVFSVGEALDTACALSTEDRDLSNDARISSGAVRVAEWDRRAWLLRGAGATAKLQKLAPDSGDSDAHPAHHDLDGDRADDDLDVFPFDPVTGRDWDHDGVEDKQDAFPTNNTEWQDSDGDGVGDHADAFPDDPNEALDSDGDGVGDHADACPDDPNESVDSDSDRVCDNEDAFPFDPLEQSDTDGDGMGDVGDAFPADASQSIQPFGQPIGTIAIAVTRRARLSGFAPGAVASSQFLTLFDDDRFKMCAVPNCVTGTFAFARGNKLALHLDIASLSQLEREFAAEAAEIVANDHADPPSPALTFYPKSVSFDGVAKLTKKGVTLALHVRFGFKRATRGARGSLGAFVYRAKGTPAQ